MQNILIYDNTAFLLYLVDKINFFISVRNCRNLIYDNNTDIIKQLLVLVKTIIRDIYIYI